ncbi:hypothetical protein Gpo141_00002424 [Globisporangium polare]
MSMLQVFINGPPGVGKTTLCKLLCAELRLEPVSTGDLLKDNIAQRTELGCIAKQCISSKTLVPDHVVIDMVAEKVLECNLRDQGWVLDGFPRTVDQCAALRRKMIVPAVVLIMELSERECSKRITGRRFDTVTGNIYHLPNVTPRDSAVLARLTKRGDDTSDRLPPRFEAYRTYGEKTNALFSGVSHYLDACKSPEELLEDVLVLLHAIRPGGDSNNSLSFSDSGMAGMTIRGNQLQQQPYAGAHLSPLPAPAQKYHQQPQKIEEEVGDEDEDTMSDMQEYNYNCDDDDGSFARLHKQLQEPQSAAIVSQKQAGTNETLSSSSAPGNNNSEELASSSVAVAVAFAAPATAPNELLAHGVDMNKFRDMLLDGFEVLKHGRRGSPHARLIFTDMDFKRIFWQKVTKDNGRTKKAKLDQSLVLADVVQAVRGMKTEVLKRTGDVAKYERYLSLVADDRTLDMEIASDALCEFLLRGFDVLLHGDH